MLWVAETTDVSFASFWRLGSLISRCWLTQFLVRALSLSGPHMAERASELWSLFLFFYKNSNIIVRSSQLPNVNGNVNAPKDITGYRSTTSVMQWLMQPKSCSFQSLRNGRAHSNLFGLILVFNGGRLLTR